MSRFFPIHPGWARPLLVVPVAALLLASAASAQDSTSSSLPSTTSFFRLERTALRDSVVRLPHQFIVGSSVRVMLDSVWVLTREKDYTLDPRWGRLRLQGPLRDSLATATDSSRHTLSVRYAYFPFHFQDSYAKRTLIPYRTPSGKDSLRVVRPTAAFSVDDIFGANLQKSGSIVRGFTVGSNRDLTLNSGFRMQLAGKLSPDIEIAASLTDENTPIQPEGTTQTLQEFDKVFVELRSSAVTATLGDFVLDLNGQEFSRLSRKLQGAKVTGDFRSGSTSGSVLLSGAVTRGKFHTMQFNGLEAVQGPYRLAGRNGERTIIVIAGTEKVYVNGEAMTRGETNDYVIDYSTGEVTFTPRRLITSASRITIDFEYTDRQYSRSLYGGQGTAGFFDDRVKFSFAFLREADDQDAPIDFSVTDSARLILAQAGNDRNKAIVSGITRVDTGGAYVRVDTLLAGGVPGTFYRYAPGDPAAKYQLTFSFVGTGAGEYIRQQIGVFVWKGPGGGDYLPIRYLPLPEVNQIADFSLDLHPIKELTLSAEYAGSNYNANRFSSLPGVAVSGEALKFAASYSPRNITIGGVDFGGLDLMLKERRVGASFVPIDRTNEIEFTRKWGVDSLASGDEETREGSIRYRPVKEVTVGGGFGTITRGEDQSSHRVEGMLSVQGPALPTVAYTVENVHAEDRPADNMSSWLRQKGSVDYLTGRFTPGFTYEGERREITPVAGSGFRLGSFAYDSYGPRLTVKDFGPLSLSAEILWRNDNMASAGILLRESNSFTQTYTGRLADRGDFSTSLDVTLREKRFSPEFKALGNADIQTVLVRSQSRYAPWRRAIDMDAYYEVATQRSARLERVFIRVPPGTGSYKYLGDLNNNGIADESEFVLTRFDGDFVAITVPTDALFPIIDLKTSLRLRITPARLLEGGLGTVRDILSALSSETYVRVDEKSSERDLKNIYLLHFSHFLQDSTTIAGSQLFTQDILICDGQPMLSARLRFSERKGLVNYSGGLERSYARERSVRVRWQLVQDISNQVDFVNKNDAVGAALGSPRVRDILSNSVAWDISYRPYPTTEVGMKFEVGKATDRFPSPALDADLNTESVRFVYAFFGAGQARVEMSREEIRLGRVLDAYPYELTGGRVAGKTWIWRAGFDYRVAQFVQASVAYDGRVEGGQPPVHTARAEVRAFF